MKIFRDGLKVKLLFLYLLFGLLGFEAAMAATNDKEFYYDTFKLGVESEGSTLDPQKTSILVDHSISQSIFDPLFTVRGGQVIPILVSEYVWETPTRWVFTLKPGVSFHDGSELTTEDVDATFRRSCRLKNYAFKNLSDICSITVLDRYRFHIDTEKPDSGLLWKLVQSYIIHRDSENIADDGFDLDQGLNGTGPYQLVSHQGYKQFKLKAFPDYHRGHAYLQNVEIYVEPDSRIRMDKFLSGEYDLIDQVPDTYLENLQEKANINNRTSHYVYRIQPDVYNDVSPEVFDHDGKLLEENPLKDIRVRQAISKALNREELVKTIYGSLGGSMPAGQVVNNTVRSASQHLKPEKQDIKAARRLLADAGYPDGFQVVIRDKDSREFFIQKIADMLEAINIKAIVKTLPASEYFPRLYKHEFSFGGGFIGFDGSLLWMLQELFSAEGRHNAGRYHNAEFEQELSQAISQTNSEILRLRALQKAHEIAMKDLAVIPVLFMSENSATRADMVYLPGDQGYTEAYYVRAH
ncbi:MAG: ABC transporter substrate-binding protein [Thiolinea sp.]